MFVRVLILTFSTIFLLDCGVNVQTGWYLFVRVSILPFSMIFLLDCGGNVQTGWYFCVFYILLKKINEDSTMLKGTEEESIEP